jgi:hypothetical protein
MNTRTAIFFAIVSGIAPGAQAVTVRGVPSGTYQVALTAAVRHGLAVVASTNMNRLIASGNFNIRCVSPYTGTIEGQRTLSASSIIGGNQLIVTVPEVIPSIRDMPGFENVPAATQLTCNMYWNASAEESQFTIGIPGVGVTIGGEKGSDSGMVPFQMYQPGAGDEAHDNGCIR